MNPRRRHVLRLLPAAALAACTDSGGKVGIPFPKVPWRIASTTPFAADIVRQIGGQAVESICVLPADVPPHAFVPSAADIRKFHTSDMVVMHGLGLESRWPEDFDGLKADGVKVYSATSLIPPAKLIRPQGPEGPADPYVWTDSGLCETMVDAIEAALREVMPKLADYFAPRAHRIRVALRDARDLTTATMKELAPGDRFLLTSHHSMRYFARQFGLEARALAEPGSPIPESLPAELAGWIADKKVSSLFREPSTDVLALRKLLKEARVNPDHVIHSLTLPAPGATALVDVREYQVGEVAGAWRYNADTIQTTLKVD